MINIKNKDYENITIKLYKLYENIKTKLYENIKTKDYDNIKII
jgi:hypothetical protein